MKLIEFSGIRPGEKLYEELLNEDEIHPEQVYEKIYRGRVKHHNKEQVDEIVEDLNHHFSQQKIIDIANDKVTKA